MTQKLPQAILFIDGNNWYHSLKRIGVDSYALDYQKVAKKLLMERRELIEIRYYIGKVRDNIAQIRLQEKRLKNLRSQKIITFLGRIEKSNTRNPMATTLNEILERSGIRIPNDIRDELTQLTHKTIPTYTEKQVDVKIAIDLVSMALKNDYDVAYLLSADGDFVPAVEEAKNSGKKYFRLAHRMDGV